MSAACLMVGAAVLSLASGQFELSWRHSVEKTEWRESWVVANGALTLTKAAVKGSGAGMDPGPGAVLTDGWWIWAPALGPVPALQLAASGATGGGWHLCADGTCRDLGAVSGDGIRLAPCAD
jgi:hypothetical protein